MLGGSEGGNGLSLLHERLPIPPIVSLRRYGDIVNLLPVVRFLSEKQNAPIKLVVHRSFSPVLDGVSYAEPIIWDGNMDDPIPAAKAHGAINAQIHGIGLKPNRSIGDYAKTAWNQLGYFWNRHVPLVFDKRDRERESKLASDTFKTELPKILVKLNGFSSPFPHTTEVIQRLADEFGSMAEIVNLDTVNAERIYDLVGLMDRAACLVSADTVTLWLSKASKVPVVAFHNPKPFLGSPPVGNVLVRTPYSEVLEKWGPIATAIHSTLFDPGGEGTAMVYSDFTPADEDAKRRNEEAFATWPMLNARLIPFKHSRGSKQIGDTRDMPFVRDMIDAGFNSGTERTVIIVNNDIRVDPKLSDSIKRSCDSHGCWWAYRIGDPGHPTDQGADLFAMTRHWWMMHRHLFPDMLLGYWWWDNLLARMMRWSGCYERERLYYHRQHKNGGESRVETPGAIYNTNLAKQWLEAHHENKENP